MVFTLSDTDTNGDLMPLYALNLKVKCVASSTLFLSQNMHFPSALGT